MPTELTQSDLDDIKEKIEDGLEEWSLKTLSEDSPRTHLGISEIGESCSRKLYYKFHWVTFEQHSGRMLRLFKRGHREEEKYVNYLEGIGCRVERFQDPILNYHPESDDYFYSTEFQTDGLVENVTGYPRHEQEAERRGLRRKQFKVSGVLGHYGGSCDGKCYTPWSEYAFLAEFKTHNTKSFTYYVANGLAKSKPQHLDQMNCYGWKLGLQYGIYFPENKNDDDIQVSVIKLDWQRAAQLERKAEEIVTAREPPPRISDNPSFFNCSYCFAKNICHFGEIPQRNCRSCRMVSAVENGEWYCSRYNDVIDKSFIPKGCEQWTPI